MRRLILPFLAMQALATASVAHAQSAAVLLEEASRLQNTGKVSEASEKWQQFLRDYPDDPSTGIAYQGLGACLLQREQWSAAIAPLQQALKRLPEGESGAGIRWNLAIARYRHAEQSTRAEDYRQAAPALRDIISDVKAPKDRQALARFYLARTETTLGNRAAARKLFEDLLNTSKDDHLAPATLLGLAALAEAERDWPLAIRTYREFLQKYPAHASVDEARFSLADALVETDQRREAEELFGELARRPQLADADYAHFRWCELAELRADYQSAAERWQSFLKKHERSGYRSHALRHAGNTNLRLERCEEARDLYALWLKENRENEPAADRIEVLLGLARCATRLAQPAEAVQRYLDAFALKPMLDDSEQTYHDAVLAALAANDIKQATRWTDTLAESQPKNVWAQQAQLHVARHFADRGEFEPALERCKSIIKADVAAVQPTALYLAGFAAMKLRKFDVAIPYYETLRDRHPQSTHTPAALYSLGVAWEGRGASSKAIAAYQHLLDHFATHPLAEQASKRVQALRDR